MQITSSRLHGAVWAELCTIKKISLDKIIGLKGLWRSLVLGIIIARLVEPGSKRFTAVYWEQTTIISLLGLPAEGVSVNDLYGAMDYLFEKII